MAQVISVKLSKGDAPSLGFRLQGGKDFGTPLVVQKVSKPYLTTRYTYYIYIYMCMHKRFTETENI